MAQKRKDDGRAPGSEFLYRTLINNLPQKIFYKDKNSGYVSCNESFAKDLGITPSEFAGKTDFDFFPKELAEKYRTDDLRIMEAGKIEEIDESYLKDGEEFFVHTVKVPIRDMDGEIAGILGIFWDVTAKKRDEEELQRYKEQLEEMVKERTAELHQANERLEGEIAEGKRREEIIAQQSQEILELSTPVLKIWEGVVAAPLIGTLDSNRTQQFMDVFLNSIVANNAPVALIDITGVPTIDTQTGQHLIEAISAARLLGTEVILTGVRPAIAQTLVHLGIDLSEFRTCSSLSSGLSMALGTLDREVVSRDYIQGDN